MLRNTPLSPGSTSTRAHTIILAVAVAASLVAGPSPDLALRLCSGRYIWEHGLPTTDPFSAAGTGRVWTNPAWLFDLGIYALYHVSDLLGVLGGKALVVFLAVRLSLWLRPEHEPVGWWSSLLAAALVAIAPRLTTGPELLNLLYTGFLLVTLSQLERRSDLVWCLIPIGVQVLWANTSGDCLLGPMIYAAWLIGRAASVPQAETATPSAWRLLWTSVSLAACCGACLVSPFGLANLRTAAHLLAPQFTWGRDVTDLVPSYQAFLGAAELSLESSIFVGLTVLALVAVVLDPAGRHFRDGPVLLIAQSLGWMFQRFVPVAALVSAVIAARQLAGWRTPRRQNVATSHLSAPGAVSHGSRLLIGRVGWVTFCLMIGVYWHHDFVRVGLVILHRVEWHPAQLSAEYVRSTGTHGTVVTPRLSDAGILLWTAWPQVHSLVDERLELHGDYLRYFSSFWNDLITNRRDPYRREDISEGGWGQSVRHYGIRAVIVRSEDVASVSSLSNSRMWVASHLDNHRVVFTPLDAELEPPGIVRGVRRDLRQEEAGTWAEAPTPHGPPRPGSFWRRSWSRTAHNVRLRVSRGEVLLALGHPIAAIRQARVALVEDPGCASAVRLLGECNRTLAHQEELQAGQLSPLRRWSTLGFLGCARRLEPEWPQTSELRHMLLSRLGEPADPGSSAPEESDLGAARTLLVEGQPLECADLLSQRRYGNPSLEIDRLELLACAYYVQGDYRAAIRLLQSSLDNFDSLTPSAARLSYEAAQLSHEAGEPDLARTLSRRATELDPNLPFAPLFLEWR